jgi:AraC family transcriptional regulator
MNEMISAMPPPNLTSSAELERYLVCPSQRSSAELGWTSMVVRSRTEPAVNDYLLLPSVPDPWLVAVTAGSRHVEVRSGDRWRSARSVPGHVAVTSPGNMTEIRWRTEGSEPLRTVHMHVEAGVFRRFAMEAADCDPRRIEIVDALAETDPLVGEMGKSLERELMTPSPAGRLLADGAAQVLAAHVLRHYCAFPITATRQNNALSPRKLRRVKDYIEAHMQASVTLDDLAAVAGMSLYHFARSFKQATGETPHGFVTRLKLERAKRLLCETDLDMPRIARALGFSSPGYLASVFRKHIGMTPGVFRDLGK